MTLIRRLVISVAAGAVFLSATATQAQQAKPKRYNEVIALLEQGKVVFGAWIKHSKDSAIEASDSNMVDFVLYDFEDDPFDVPNLRDFLQYMINPARVLRTGGTFKPTLVRVPAPGHSVPDWVIHNILHNGAHGIITPEVETVGETRNIVNAMEDPNANNSARVWGMTGQEYRAKATIWPMNPQGELINMPMIESETAVNNAREILSTPGVSMIFIGPGSMAASYKNDAKKTEEAIQRVLALAKERNIPVGITAGPANVEQRIKEGFRILFTGGLSGASAETLVIGHKAAGR